MSYQNTKSPTLIQLEELLRNIEVGDFVEIRVCYCGEYLRNNASYCHSCGKKWEELNTN